MVYDEISLEYWKQNSRKINSKSYLCYHNGYVYGENMQCKDIEFIYVSNNCEIRCNGEKGRIKQAYIKLLKWHVIRQKRY